MKKLLLIIILMFLNAQTIKAQTVVLDANGVTIKWTGTTVPSPYFIQASPRGTMEWFAIVDNSKKDLITLYATDYQSGITYFTPPDSSTPVPFNNIVTTLVTDMSLMFYGNTFNPPIINSWDVSNVTDMSAMFYGANAFNQPIGSWNVSNVTDMRAMFYQATAFNQPIGSWDVSNVTDMTFMFDASDFNQPIGSWNVANVTNMRAMFQGSLAFNQNIGSWNVGNVTDMSYMFSSATSFNQPVGSWNVSNVTDMNCMFQANDAFNQPIGSWDVRNVTDMGYMFTGDAFNQPIGSWDVRNVTNMGGMFYANSAFNQPIGSWNVSNVTNMSYMFASVEFSSDNAIFNQPIGSWNVSNVTDMSSMFYRSTSFNQPIGTWNVSNVTSMWGMFDSVQLSTANYDDLLIGWSTISPNETPLQLNVPFSGGTSNYCNGSTARSSIISTYGWTISDAGLDSNCVLETETFDKSSLKLYPNPVLSIINIKADYDLMNQPYNIFDCLGRVVLNGKLNEVDTTINVEQLSKGIYYLKLSDNNASKFIKE